MSRVKKKERRRGRSGNRRGRPSRKMVKGEEKENYDGRAFQK